MKRQRKTQCKPGANYHLEQNKRQGMQSQQVTLQLKIGKNSKYMDYVYKQCNVHNGVKMGETYSKAGQLVCTGSSTEGQKKRFIYPPDQILAKSQVNNQ